MFLQEEQGLGRFMLLRRTGGIPGNAGLKVPCPAVLSCQNPKEEQRLGLPWERDSPEFCKIFIIFNEWMDTCEMS